MADLRGWLESNEFVIGAYTAALWRRVALDGVQDHTTLEMIKGAVDFHVHLSRAGTLRREYMPNGTDISAIAGWTLPQKQIATANIHTGLAFTEEHLCGRIRPVIEAKIFSGDRECWAIADTVPQVGLKDFGVLRQLKEEYAGRIDIKVGAYAQAGFKDPHDDPKRLNVILDALKAGAEFLVGLPERDDELGRVGFEGHVTTLLELGEEHHVPVQVHVDQMNSKVESGAFRMIRALQSLNPAKRRFFVESVEPRLWAVHVISPSRYDPSRFNELLDLLLRYNIGVVVCPSAAISMRQLRSEEGPVFNSIARVIEMLARGVHVRLGTDNVNDMFIPSGTGNIIVEASQHLTNVLREYTLHIIAKLVLGMKLDGADRALLHQSLMLTAEACKDHRGLLERIDSVRVPYDF